MRAKKRLRQEAQREQKKIEERNQMLESMQTVLLTKDDSLYGNYRWKCPSHDGTFSWSRQINAQWGHPEDLAFCAVCCKYLKVQFE